MTLARRLRNAAFALSVAVTMHAFAQQTGLSPQAQALIVQARDVTAQIARLTPESAKALPQAEALKLYVDFQEAAVGVMHVVVAEAVRQVGGTPDGSTIKRILAQHGIESVVADATYTKFELLAARVTAEQARRVETDLRLRYPAYDHYVRRTLGGSVIAALSDPISKLTDDYRRTRTLPAAADDAILRGVRARKGVRAAQYREGRFTIHLDAEIQEGGTFSVVATQQSDGSLGWRCVASNVESRLLPPACRP